MPDHPVVLISGTSRGIGRGLASHYLGRGFAVVGCSRGPCDLEAEGYRHHCLDVADEAAVRRLMADDPARPKGRLDALINNAGIAAMNHALLTPMTTVRSACWRPTCRPPSCSAARRRG